MEHDLFGKSVSIPHRVPDMLFRIIDPQLRIKVTAASRSLRRPGRLIAAS
jgi:hypothetical protein